MPYFGTDPLHGISHSDAYKEAVIYADPSVVMHATLAFNNPNFIDENGAPSQALIVNDHVALVATLEADAPLGGGTEVTFYPVPFEFTPPSEKEGNGNAEVSFSVDNISREITQYLKQTLGSMDITTVTLREYLSTDTSGPHIDPPLTLELISARSTVERVEGTAAYGRLSDSRFPREIFDRSRFPGLEAR